MASVIRVTKEFPFEMAHALWNYDGPCRNVHGHSYRLFVTLSGVPLEEEGNPKNGMVIDFNELKVIKEFLDGFVDHRFLIDIEDPLLKSWMEKYGLKMEDLKVNDAGFVFNQSCLQDQCEIEFFDSFVILPFVPTSENLALWLFSVVEGLVHKVNKELGKRVKMVKLRWWESDSSFAEVDRS